MLPGVRSVVSVPAGLSEMRVPVFVALTALGSALWNAALIGAGWALGGTWREVGEVVGPLTLPGARDRHRAPGGLRAGPRAPRARGVSEHRFLDALRVDLLRHAELRPERRDHLLFQTSTIDALLAGHFDGDVTIGELGGHGDLGLGTLNGCDGELVVVDGQAWQARLDGSLHRVPDDALTPYAVVTRFDPDRHVQLEGPLDFDALTARLDAAGRPGAESAAVRIEGSFASMRVRSVPRQEPPYPPLADVVAQQQVTDLERRGGHRGGLPLPRPAGGDRDRGLAPALRGRGPRARRARAGLRARPRHGGAGPRGRPARGAAARRGRAARRRRRRRAAAPARARRRRPA